MINEKQAKDYCCEDISKIYGYKEAVADKEKMWHLHHCLGLVWSIKQLIEMGLYYNQPADRLMFVTPSEHKKLHFIANEETRKRISKAKKGAKMSIESRKKMSESRKGQKNTHLCKKVCQYTKNGEFVKEFQSIMEVEKYYGYANQNISACCRGKHKSAYGFVWRYSK